MLIIIQENVCFLLVVRWDGGPRIILRCANQLVSKLIRPITLLVLQWAIQILKFVKVLVQVVVLLIMLLAYVYPPASPTTPMPMSIQVIVV